jgi:hypothetical protein
VVPDEAELAWRARADTLHASWSTWRIGPAMRSDATLERFVAEGYRRFAPVIRRLGLIDMLMIRYGEDELAVLNLYADPVAGQAAYAEAGAAVAAYASGHFERIAVRTGQAFDLAMLLTRTS